MDLREGSPRMIRVRSWSHHTGACLRHITHLHMNPLSYHAWLAWRDLTCLSHGLETSCHADPERHLTTTCERGRRMSITTPCYAGGLRRPESSSQPSNPSVKRERILAYELLDWFMGCMLESTPMPIWTRPSRISPDGMSWRHFTLSRSRML